MVTEYGMSDRLGLVTMNANGGPCSSGELFLRQILQRRESRQIDGEISRIIGEAHSGCGILSERRKILEDLAHLLLEKEVVPGRT